MLDFDMGRYGAFVWPSFAISAAVLLWMIVDSTLRARRWKREVERLDVERKP